MAMIVCGALGPAFLLGVDVLLASAVAAADPGRGLRDRPAAAADLAAVAVAARAGGRRLVRGRPVRPRTWPRHGAVDRRGARRDLAGAAADGRPGAARRQRDRQPAGLSGSRACGGRLPAAAGGPAGRRQRRSGDHAVGQPGDPALGGAMPVGRRQRCRGPGSPCAAPCSRPWWSGRRSPHCGWCTAEAGSFDSVRTANRSTRQDGSSTCRHLLDKLKAKPWVAHLIRAAERFTNRLGSQFAAAVTYFSVLAMVPLLLLAFSILGFVLTVLHPEVHRRRQQGGHRCTGWHSTPRPRPSSAP